MLISTVIPPFPGQIPPPVRPEAVVEGSPPAIVKCIPAGGPVLNAKGHRPTAVGHEATHGDGTN